MTCNAQSNAKVGIEQTFLGTQSQGEFSPENTKWDFVMGVEINGFSVTALCIALLAGVVIAQKYSGSPSDIWLGLPQCVVFCGFAAFPIGGFWTNSTFGAINMLDQIFSSFEVMKRKIFGYADCGSVHVSTDGNRLPASTLAKVLFLVFRDPLINASVIGATVIAGIRVVFNSPCHGVSLYQVQLKFTSKQDELLDPRPACELHVEGNQQLSRKYTCGKFRDYLSRTVGLITG